MTERRPIVLIGGVQRELPSGDTLPGGGGSSLSHRWMFGDGSDGDVTISADTQLTRDMYYDDLTVNSGVTLDANGYDIHVAGTLTVDGTIRPSVPNGNSASAQTAGAAGANDNGNSGQYCRWHSMGGSAGGDGGGISSSGSAGSSGAVPQVALIGGNTTTIRLSPMVAAVHVSRDVTIEDAIIYGARGGNGGDGGNGGMGNPGGGGGGGGAGARGLRAFAKSVLGGGSITVPGGAGGDGGNGGDGDGANSGGNGGNGGNGGDGGALLVVSESFGGTVTYSCPGGAGGNKGLGGADNGGGGGSDGADGSAGSAGYIIKYNPTSGVFS